MTVRKSSVTKIVLAVGGSAAVIGALVLIFIAAFPYVYAESGSARYVRDHRGEAILQAIAAGALLVVAWRCIRYSLSGRTWMIIAGLLVAVALIRSVSDNTRTPDGVQPVGGGWHVVVVPQPGEIDTVLYHLYYKRGSRYQSIEDLAGEYRLVPPDCITYRGLKVVGRPMYAMCGYRAPVERYDTTANESELLDSARVRPTFRTDWRTTR